MFHARRGPWGFGIVAACWGSANHQLIRRRPRRWRSGFPSASRPFAMGFVNAGSNVGAVLAPLFGAVAGAELRMAVGVYRAPGLRGFSG